ncbi:hypothetical protein E2C01_005056 [Portunus trituberculatus]|uniref:Uncharacterized protein n=1 Tax=Portunus trituberculatus TaxID=210409 RepID=A0A5B7CT92_PORTR|nr:hypothetical protein [Portunus trituberculatus]
MAHKFQYSDSAPVVLTVFSPCRAFRVTQQQHHNQAGQWPYADSRWRLGSQLLLQYLVVSGSCRLHDTCAGSPSMVLLAVLCCIACHLDQAVTADGGKPFIDKWNKLSSDVFDAVCVNQIKERYDRSGQGDRTQRA